jgi:hypothetical protein
MVGSTIALHHARSQASKCALRFTAWAQHSFQRIFPGLPGRLFPFWRRQAANERRINQLRPVARYHSVRLELKYCCRGTRIAEVYHAYSAG